MKRLIVVLVIALFAFSFVACSGGGDDGGARRVYKIGFPQASAMNAPMFTTVAFADMPTYEKRAEFDENGRVTRMDVYDSSGLKMSFNDWQYDENGRVTGRIAVGEAPFNFAETITYGANSYTVVRVGGTNETLVYTTDENGNITSINRDGGAVEFEYAYDEQGRISEYSSGGNTFSFVYAGDGLSAEVYLGVTLYANMTFDENGNLLHWETESASKSISYAQQDGENTTGEWWRMFTIFRPNENPESMFSNPF